MSRHYDTELLDWRYFGVAPHDPEHIASLDLDHTGTTNCLRLLISRNGMYTSSVPDEFAWCLPAILRAAQDNDKLSQNPYVYLTVRHGVDWEHDDEWHVDGFSMRAAHIPEQNYVWCSEMPTEWWPHRERLPSGFDPMRDNIHRVLQRQIAKRETLRPCPMPIALDPRNLYRLSPYVVHRRPNTGTWPDYRGEDRVFVRVSFVPIPIHDINNTPNPMLRQPHGSRDGVRDFRDSLR